MNRIIREARPTDMAEIMQVMDAAKGIMRQSGNMHQWGDGYPSETVIDTLLSCNPQNRHIIKSMMANGLMTHYLIM